MLNLKYFIPQENRVPIVEIREIESLEHYHTNWTTHFWKVMQASGIVSKSLLKSFNPETYIFYCDWHNPRCTCYVNEGYVPLNTACPACTSREPHQWIHRNCGGQTYISRNIRIKCMSCHVEHHWKDWSWKCNNASHAGFRRVTSSNSFLNALSIAAGMNAEDGETTDIIADISIRLIQEARNQTGTME